VVRPLGLQSTCWGNARAARLHLFGWSVALAAHVRSACLHVRPGAATTRPAHTPVTVCCWRGVACACNGSMPALLLGPPLCSNKHACQSAVLATCVYIAGAVIQRGPCAVPCGQLEHKRQTVEYWEVVSDGRWWRPDRGAGPGVSVMHSHGHVVAIRCADSQRAGGGPRPLSDSVATALVGSMIVGIWVFIRLRFGV
jgi:hypothetical protein